MSFCFAQLLDFTRLHEGSLISANHFSWNLNVFLTSHVCKMTKQTVNWLFSAEYFQCYLQSLTKNTFFKYSLNSTESKYGCKEGKTSEDYFVNLKDTLFKLKKYISYNHPWDFFDLQCKFQPAPVKHEQLLRLWIQIQRFTKNADILEARDVSFYKTFSFRKSMRWTGKSFAFWLNWHWMLQ